MLMLGELIMRAGKALTDLRDRIYKLQSELGTTFMSAITAGTSAIQNQIISFFSAGPVLSFQDTIDTINAFQKENAFANPGRHPGAGSRVLCN